MKELSLCERMPVQVYVGITKESWDNNLVEPKSFVCSYATPILGDDSYIACELAVLNDDLRCPIYEVIKRRMNNG